MEIADPNRPRLASTPLAAAATARSCLAWGMLMEGGSGPTGPFLADSSTNPSPKAKTHCIGLLGASSGSPFRIGSLPGGRLAPPLQSLFMAGLNRPEFFGGRFI